MGDDLVRGDAAESVELEFLNRMAWGVGSNGVMSIPQITRDSRLDRDRRFRRP